MWKMCWVGRGEEKSRGALSRSSCFSLVFGTGRRPIIEQTPAEVKFCSPIAKENGWFLASHENLTAIIRSQPTNKKRTRMRCLQWTVILASWKVLLEGSLYVWCCNITSIIFWMSHFWKVKPFKHIYTFSFPDFICQEIAEFPHYPILDLPCIAWETRWPLSVFCKAFTQLILGYPCILSQTFSIKASHKIVIQSNSVKRIT